MCGPAFVMEDFDILNNFCTKQDIQFERVLDRTYTIFDDKQLISLDLSNMHLNHLVDSKFAKFKYLQYLDLSNNNIELISDKTFENCSSICNLHIQENKFLTLQPGAFQNMNELLELNITLNDEKSLAVLSECDIPNLTILTLKSDNTLPRSLFCKMTKLRNLIIICPRKLDEKLFVNINIRYLKLSKMKSISGVLLDPLHNLVELHLIENKLNSLPIEIFSNLQNLKILNLSRNQIKSLNKEIFFYLNQLEELDLSNNNISVLHDSLFDNLYSLNILNLSENALDSIYYKKTNIYF